MLMLNRRLQVLIDDERYAALKREAARTNSSVAAVVRAAIDERLAPAAARRSRAGRRLLDAPSTPAGEPDELEAEIALMSDRRAGS